METIVGMSEQFSFPGFEAPVSRQRQAKAPRVERPFHSLFFAILPALVDLPRIDAAASAVRRQHGVERGLVKTERLHVTCCDLGDFNEAPAQTLVDAAVAVAAGLARSSFEIVFDRVMRFKGSRALALLADDGAGELKAFRAALGQALSQAGLGVDAGGAPHMTLGYGGDDVSESLAQPIRWTAQDFVLVHSLVGKGEHRHLGRWPLAPN